VLIFILFLAALGVAAGVITAQIVADDNGSGGGSGSGATPQIASVSDFDPLGDGQENPGAVQAAIDGNAATVWSSERYESRDMGGLKPGVGLVLTLTGPATVSSVAIDGAAGADVEIFVADEPSDDIAGWGPVRASATDLSGSEVLDLDPSVTGASVLVWFTRTPESGRIDVAELRVS
jgi:hypothetical protein